ncbi:aldo/keto reductase [Cryobacterium sp. MDB2-33-2]|nr:aldo/keto reductase [Cryobacterium sp. MDB2-33-2]
MGLFRTNGGAQPRDRVGLRGSNTHLLLIHWPCPEEDLFVSTWKTFEHIMASGLARSIGVSNFKASHLERLRQETDVIPAVNQIQLNPYIARIEERRYDATHGIATTSWSPLGQGNSLLAESVIVALAEKYHKTTAQIVLRWHVELGLIAIPKSANVGRLQQNLDVFEFVLEFAEVAAISALDGSQGAGVDSDFEGH